MGGKLGNDIQQTEEKQGKYRSRNDLIDAGFPAMCVSIYYSISLLCGGGRADVSCVGRIISGIRFNYR